MHLTPEQSVLAALLTCGIGALLVLFVARHRRFAGILALVATVIASAFALFAAGRVVLTGHPGTPLTLWTLQQWGFALRIYVDGLSALFLTLIALVSPLAVLYSIAYLDHCPQRGVGRYYPNLLLFLAGMVGLVTTTDAMFFFFVFWQLMTLTSFLLIRFESERPENLRAANRYLLLMEIACALTMIGAEMLAHSAVKVGNETLMKYDFDAISHHLPVLLVSRPGWVTAAFALFLVGFGIKAGMWPFGRWWLPDAHPAAPSPVSALLSGVMIKTGVYGLMRYFLWFIPETARADYPAAAWGAAIAILGTLTLLIGTAQALHAAQTKRLLAYSSIGQVGYILLGLGVCLSLVNSPLAPLGALALYGALFHTLNHGLFKSLLFLNAGSMLHATGTQQLDRLGGLMRFMPLTAVTALVGTLCIAGAPLTNGFASKWSLYVAAVQGAPAAWYLPVCALVAVFTSGLTLAVFLRFFGAAFLSRTSSLVADQARARARLEVPAAMQVPQVLLALACLAFGLAPAFAYHVIGVFLNASQQGLGATLARAVPVAASSTTGLAVSGGTAVLSPLVLLAVLAAMLLLAFGLSRLGAAPRRVTAPWLCGYAQETELHRYHAGQFFGELRRWFRRLPGFHDEPGRRTHRPPPPAPAPITPPE